MKRLGSPAEQGKLHNGGKSHIWEDTVISGFTNGRVILVKLLYIKPLHRLIVSWTMSQMSARIMQQSGVGPTVRSPADR